MRYIALSVYFLVAFVLLYVALSLIWAFINMFRKKFVPFVPTAYDVLPDLQKLLNLSEKSVMYDLGCGDGRILSACHNTCPNATCIGIEKQLGPFILGRIKHRKRISRKFKIIRGDFFKHTYENATHITLYLFPEIMDALLPKLEKELRPGTKVLSIDFPFSNKQYKDLVYTSRSVHLTGRRIFVYEF